MPALLRALTVLLALAVLLGLGLPGAAAHEGLRSSIPAAEAVVATAPDAVRLEFSGPVQALGTDVVVSGPDGAVVTEGPVDVDGVTVTAPLAAGLDPARYTVDWRITSTDGHTVSGTFSFTIGDAAAPDTPASEAAPSEAAPSEAATTTAASSDGGPPVALLAVGAIAALAGGVLLSRRLRARSSGR